MVRTDEELIQLISKFKRDINKRSRVMRFLLVLDQMLNVLWLNGSQDETVSSHLGRKRSAGTITWFEKKVCCALRKIESKHCIKSLGE